MENLQACIEPLWRAITHGHGSQGGARAFPGHHPSHGMPGCTVPPALAPGDQIAIVQPAAAAGSGSHPDHLLELGVERLRTEFDLEPVIFDSVRKSGGWLYDHPAFRARELEEVFRAPEIRGVIAVLGGNDQLRVLPDLDGETIREHPTRFYGSSDNTSFAAFCREHGVASFYGGDLYTDVAEPGGLNDYTREQLRRAFFEPSLGELPEADRFTDHGLDWTDSANLERELNYEPTTGRRWHVAETGPDRVEGRTWGGCLAVLAAHFVADRVLPNDPAGTVLLIETSEELPPAGMVRRVLTGVGQRGYLNVGAVLVGRAKARTYRENVPAQEREAFRERQREAVVETVREHSDAIVVTDCEFGHTKPIAPLPIGGRAVVDATSRTLRFP